MSSHPALLRTSAPSLAERVEARFAEVAETLTIRELADVLGCSKSTAARRRHGHGWHVGEAMAFYAHLGLDIAADVRLAEGDAP